MYDLVLASSSPYRKRQLASLGFIFRVVAPLIDESVNKKESPCELAIRLASLKAKAVSEKFPHITVIGSDQTGELNGTLLRKPVEENRARDMLLSFRDQTVIFYSAVVVLSPHQSILSDVVATEVQFREFTRIEATKYLMLDQPMDCVGAFKSEAHGPLLFKSVRSEDPTALIGLPLIRTTEFLREIGINPLASDYSKTLQNTGELGREY